MTGPWRHKAACDGKDTNYWFPEAGPNNPGTARALAICRSCEVQLQCLTHAQEQPEHHGIWGGLTASERLGLRRSTVTIDHGTNTGYNRHLAYGQTPCEPCKRAHNEVQAAKRRIRQRAQTRHQIEEIS